MKCFSSTLYPYSEAFGCQRRPRNSVRMADAIMLKRIPELRILHISKVILVSMIETLKSASLITFPIFPYAYIAVDNGQSCSPNGSSEDCDEPWSIPRGIFWLEEQWPGKIA